MLLSRLLWRRMALRGFQSNCLVYNTYGDPLKVIKLETRQEEESVSPNQVRIRWMAAPINPADINMIQGIYPIKPKLPAVGGNEGVGRITQVGSSVSDLKSGDWILPSHAGQGTWRTESVCEADDVIPVSRDLSVAAAATLLVNPPTAYRMLHDFTALAAGDCVIQNGATSAIAKEIGVKSVNLVRDKDDIGSVKRELEELGADVVLTEKELKANKDLWKKFPVPKLALNCVGGKSVLYLASCLAAKGKIVTYGGMSKMPLQVPTGPLIFKQIELHGYWMSRWYSTKEDRSEAVKMIDFLSKLILRGKLKEKESELRPMEQFETALENALSGRKQILTLE